MPVHVEVSGPNWAEWVAALAAVAAAFFAWRLLRVAQTELGQVLDSFRQNALDRERQINELTEQRAVMQRQTELADQTMRNQLLPVMTVFLRILVVGEPRKPVLFSPALGTPLVLTIRNIGAGAAVASRVNIWLVAKDDEALFAPPDDKLLETLGEPHWLTEECDLAPGESAYPEIGTNPNGIDPKGEYLGLYWGAIFEDAFGVEHVRRGAISLAPRSDD